MKKLIAAAVFISLVAGMYGCTPEKTEESSVSEAVSVISSDESSEESSKTNQSHSEAEENSLPEHITEEKKGYLKFTDSTGKVSATFPDTFSLLCTEYSPTDGIYLQNSDGTATLQIEAIKSEGVNRDSLVDYLKENYPDAEIYVNDSKNIIFKSTVTDTSGNKSVCFMKAVITGSGYNEAVLYCKEGEESKYESLFNRISIS